MSSWVFICTSRGIVTRRYETELSRWRPSPKFSCARAPTGSDLSGEKEAYATKSESRRAFDKLSEPEKARRAVAEESPSIMAVWGTPDDCLERINYYVDSIHPEQLMLNIASGSLVQEKILNSMRLCAEAVMPALRGVKL